MEDKYLMHQVPQVQDERTQLSDCSLFTLVYSLFTPCQHPAYSLFNSLLTLQSSQLNVQKQTQCPGRPSCTSLLALPPEPNADGITRLTHYNSTFKKPLQL